MNIKDEDQLHREIGNCLKGAKTMRKMAASEWLPNPQAMAERDFAWSFGVFQALTSVISEVAGRDSPKAVKAICQVFSSSSEAYRLWALDALAGMSNPDAVDAIGRRTSFLSFASHQERARARLLLRDPRAAAVETLDGLLDALQALLDASSKSRESPESIAVGILQHQVVIPLIGLARQAPADPERAREILDEAEKSLSKIGPGLSPFDACHVIVQRALLLVAILRRTGAH